MRRSFLLLRPPVPLLYPSRPSAVPLVAEPSRLLALDPDLTCPEHEPTGKRPHPKRLSESDGVLEGGRVGGPEREGDRWAEQEPAVETGVVGGEEQIGEV